MRNKEGDKRWSPCAVCDVMTEVTLTKAAHVPTFAWVCEGCRDKWVAE